MGCGGSKEDVATGNMVRKCRTLLSNKSSNTIALTNKTCSSMASTTSPSSTNDVINAIVTEKVGNNDQKDFHEAMEEDEERKIARVRTIQKASKESMDEYFSPKKSDDDVTSITTSEGADDAFPAENLLKGDEEVHEDGGTKRSSGEAKEKVNDKNVEAKDDTMALLQEDKEATSMTAEMVESGENSSVDVDNVEKKNETDDIKETPSTH